MERGSYYRGTEDLHIQSEIDDELQYCISHGRIKFFCLDLKNDTHFASIPLRKIGEFIAELGDIQNVYTKDVRLMKYLDGE